MASPRTQPISRDSTPVGPGSPGALDRSPRDVDANLTPDWLRQDEQRESALSAHLPERWRGARLDPGRTGMLALCGVGVTVLIVAGYAMLRDAPVVAPVPTLPIVQPISEVEVAPSGTAAPPSTIVVSVVGLVASSGLVNLPAGSRVADALEAAGGPLDGADVLALNLAAKLADGDQIVVGAPPLEGRPIISGTVQDSAPGSASTSATGATGAAGDGSAGGTVNLNTATVAELDALDGVGPVTAASIIAWREANGAFKDVGQLAEVDGIGPVRLEKLRGQVTV